MNEFIESTKYVIMSHLSSSLEDGMTMKKALNAALYHTYRQLNIIGNHYDMGTDEVGLPPWHWYYLTIDANKRIFLCTYDGQRLML